MKKFNFKDIFSKKHGYTAIAFGLGVIMLTGSVYANYDDAKGYSRAKAGIKNWILYSDNYSIKAKASLEINGKALTEADVTFKYDDGKTYNTSKLLEKGKIIDETEGWNDGDYTYDKRSNGYYKNDSYGTYRDEINLEDPQTRKAIRFGELLGDAIVGDLKNNLILKENKDGFKTYAMNISGNQIPEIINAGISLNFGFLRGIQEERNQTEGIIYDNHYLAVRKFYEKEEGKEFEEYYDKDEDYEKSREEIEKYEKKMNDYYSDIMEKESEGTGKGVLIVKQSENTGNLEHYYYATIAEYMEKEEKFNPSVFSKMMGSDPYISNLKEEFQIDKKNNIKKFHSSVTLTGKGIDGKKYDLVFKIEGKGYDYDKTKVEFDEKGKKIIDGNYQIEEKTTVTEEIEN